jgi:hypothetical protein
LQKNDNPSDKFNNLIIAVVQFLIETDVLTEYLIAPAGEETLLRTALAKGVCYTTMLNALELFRKAQTKSENDAIMQMLLVVRVLGFNSRYAESFAAAGKEIENKTGLNLSERELMIVGMANVSKLSIITKKYFSRYSEFNVVPVQQSLQEVPSAQ